MAFNPLDPEWPKQTADLIDRFVQGIRSKFTAKAVTATNAVVYGSLALFALLVASVVGMVVAVRSLEAYLTWSTDRWPQWMLGGIALFGVLLVLVGAVKSSKALLVLGFAFVIVGGARWALDITDSTIEHETSVWISYLTIGGLFVLVGAFLMGKRHARPES
jgi:hypothetical protein